MSIIRRFLNLFRDREISRDIEREMRFHIDERADELLAKGYDMDRALREARRRFGNEVYQREETRSVDLMTSLDTFVADLRYALRTLAASPLFAMIAILSLALGIGANTAIFSLINAVMLKPLPVSHPEQLVQLNFDKGKDDNGVYSNPLWEAVRDRQDVLSGVFAAGSNSFNLANGGVVDRIDGAMVSGDFFRTLGVQPVAGRLLSKADDYRGCTGAAVIGYSLWQRNYGGDRDVIGKTISLDGHAFPIVGVTSPSFYGVYVGTNSQVYVPLCAEAVLNAPNSMLDRRGSRWLRVMGRMQPGTTLESVQARLRALAPAAYQATIPEKWGPKEKAEYVTRSIGAVSAPSGISWVRTRYSKALLAIMVIVAVVLVIACANVANLLLARATTRQREVAVRLALGAGRGRLVRQLLTESLLLSGTGALLGILFARWGSALLVRFLSSHNLTVSLDLSLDNRVLLFTILIASATGVLFGLAPAWRSSKVQPQTVMKAAGRSIVEGHSRFSIGKALVVAQIALSLVLVMGAALLLGSFRSLASMDPGFEKNGILLARLDMSSAKNAPASQAALYHQVLDRARGIPGVRSAAISNVLPISGTSWNEAIAVNGFIGKSTEDSLAWYNSVSNDYFKTYGMRMLAGRDFDARDVPHSTPVAVVNEAFARKYFKTDNVVGRRYATTAGGKILPPIEIIGVVNNTKYDDLKVDAGPIAYVTLNQDSAPGSYYQVSLKTNGDYATVIEGLKTMATEIDPAASLDLVRLDLQVSESIQRERLLATLSGFFGALALLLAMIGLYGIMAYNVARRRSEIGIRMALGSARTSVIGMVLREVSGMVIGGVMLGSIAVFAGMRLLASLLYNVSPTDPRMFAASALTLAIVAGLAGAVPAWRAGLVDPMEALREE